MQWLVDRFVLVLAEKFVREMSVSRMFSWMCCSVTVDYMTSFWVNCWFFVMVLMKHWQGAYAWSKTGVSVGLGRRNTRRASSTSTEMADRKEEIYHNFFSSRDWYAANEFWSSIVRLPSNAWPAFVKGKASPGYGVTDISLLNKAGLAGEFSSKDTRYMKRFNYAIQVGYVGNRFHGYQIQSVNVPPKPIVEPSNEVSHTSSEEASCKDIDLSTVTAPPQELATVEGSLRKGLDGLACFGAGRTDRGVHAVSQIVNFATSDTKIDQHLLLQRLRNSPMHAEGYLQVYDCVRVPKSFHSRSSATWRRYLYVFPLMPRSDSTADTMNDLYLISKTLMKTRSMEYLRSIFKSLEMKEFSYSAYTKKGSDYKKTNSQTEEARVMQIEPVLGPVMRRPISPNTASLEDRCILFHTDAYLLDLNSQQIIVESSDVQPSQIQKPAICIELVGNRFLRQMVRILVGTAIRETITFGLQGKDMSSPGNHSVLVDIANKSERQFAAMALPPHGLCFAGVGYDYKVLSLYKRMPKDQMQKVLSDSSF